MAGQSAKFPTKWRAGVLGFWVSGSGFLGCMGFRVQGLGFRVWGGSQAQSRSHSNVGRTLIEAIGQGLLCP